MNQPAVTPLRAEAPSPRIALFGGDAVRLVAQEAMPQTRPYTPPQQAPGGGILTENAPAHHPRRHGLRLFSGARNRGKIKSAWQAFERSAEGEL